MTRPRTYDEPRVATAIRLPVSMHEELRAHARARDVSVNLLVIRAVSDYLQRLPSPERARADALRPVGPRRPDRPTGTATR